MTRQWRGVTLISTVGELEIGRGANSNFDACQFLHDIFPSAKADKRSFSLFVSWAELE